MTLQTDLETAVAQTQANADKLKAIVNGPASGEGSTVETDSGSVKTIARAIAEAEADFTASEVLSGATAAAAAAGDAQGAAETARDAAIAAVGSVKVSVDDTAPATLESKLESGGLVNMETQNPGGSETVKVSVPKSSQVQAEAGLDDETAMTPLRTAQAIEALSSSADAVARADIVNLAWLRAEDHGKAAFALKNTYVDVLVDQSGIDTGASSGIVYDGPGEFITNQQSVEKVCEGGYDSQVFDGSGTTGNWSGYVGGNGVQNSSFGSIGGKTAWQFYASSTASNTYSGITIDVGNWHNEFCATYEMYITDLSAMGVLVQGSTPAYQFLNMSFILNAGRRTTVRLGGDGQLWIGNDGAQDVGSGAGVIQEATWQKVTVWGKMNSSNVVTDFKCWVDGVLVVDVSGKSYSTSSTGSDGTAFLQMSGESGSALPKVHIHSAKMGRFVVHSEDQFYAADYVTASNYASVSSGNPGCQSFQVDDTNRIIGASFYIHDSTGLPVTFDVHLRPDSAGAPDAGTSLASATGIASPVNDVGGLVEVTFGTSFTPETETTYWLCIENASGTFRVSFESTGSYPSGNARYGGSNQAGADMDFHIAQDRSSSLDMTLVSETITADSDPLEVRPFFDIEKMESATENVDFTASVSRDGTTWSAVSLVRQTGLVGDRAIYAPAAPVDVSGQPIGAGVRVKIASPEKGLRIHRIAVQADQPLSA